MQLSDTITIYLAIAAPFGVNYFLRERDRKKRRPARSFFKATGAGLLWPLVAVAALLSRQSAAVPLPATAEDESSLDERTRGKIATAQHQLSAALERVRELAWTTAAQGEDLEQRMRAVREAIEKYVGLTLALAEADPDAPPTSREMELCRMAGRKGDDLVLAGRCVHRRNVTRLIVHQARSRTELLHALSTVREMEGAESTKDVTAARRLSVAVLRFYGHAINLLSLLEDESGATSAARLLDAECARLRRLEALNSNRDETIRTDGQHVRHTQTDRAALARR